MQSNVPVVPHWDLFIVWNSMLQLRGWDVCSKRRHDCMHKMPSGNLYNGRRIRSLHPMPSGKVWIINWGDL